MQQQALALDTMITKRVALRYLLWLPSGFAQAGVEPWPLIVFLHGRGERGDDLAQVTQHGLARKLEAGFELPAIAAAPQCPAHSDWTLHDDAILALIDDLCSSYHIDQQRIYLTGLSMGGRGTWRLAAEHAERFAAIVPICGRRPDGVRSAEDAERLCTLPVWVFHGAQDQVVPIEESDAMVAALRAYGADVRYTIYPDAGHDSWTRAYDEPELYTWLLRQRRTTG